MVRTGQRREQDIDLSGTVGGRRRGRCTVRHSVVDLGRVEVECDDGVTSCEQPITKTPPTELLTLEDFDDD